ncbi:hypothetical protein LAV79_28140 [Peribacillus butanolivorans]|uniref:hypothetical protein n=1 Tax=Peribacillus butanolivorans TaxID=421767 RepID=UPI0030C9FCBE
MKNEIELNIYTDVGYMDKGENAAGLKTLNFLCNGAKIEGLSFYGLRLLLSESETNSNRINGQIYINIESQFCLFNSLPKNILLTNVLPTMDLIESLKFFVN